MSFIGVISDSKKFDILKNLMQKNKNKNNFTLININRKSISNLKNVKFDIVVILNLIEIEGKNLQEICKGVKYLVVNSDIEFKENLLQDVKANIITFGLNHLSTVTFSSVTDDAVLISVQRNFPNKKGNMVDVGEYGVKIHKRERVFLHEILVSFIIKKL